MPAYGRPVQLQQQQPRAGDTRPTHALPRPATASAPPAPRFRAQDQDDPRSSPKPVASAENVALLQMPSPEQLGVVQANPVAPDWAEAHRRFDQLGATCFQVERLPQGGCRVVCLLSTGRPDRSHRIEAEALTEAEAVRLALEKAEQWTLDNRTADKPNRS